MFNYSAQLEAYESERVNLSEATREDLYQKRQSNRNRVKGNLPTKIRISDSQFIPQGSMAIRTTVQEVDCDYDIDDGVWLYEEDLKEGPLDLFNMSVAGVQSMICEALKDDKFKKQPEILGNCVRVYYAEGYHVDVPAFRIFNAGTEKEHQELAGENGWRASDPTEINRWFEGRVQELNRVQDDAGGQFRRMIRLMKRFARSRRDKWDMPNGLKLTMLSEECFNAVKGRDDEAFVGLLERIQARLDQSLVVYNRAQAQQPQDQLTKTTSDKNMIELKEHAQEALTQLQVLGKDNCTKKAARKAWDWVFQSGGFFDDFDDKHGDDDDTRGIAPVAPTAPFVKKETRFGE